VTRPSPSPLSLTVSSGSSPLTSKIRANLTDELLAALENSFPASFNLAIVNHSDVLYRAWGGNANTVGQVVRATADTQYDLASVSKIVATTTLALWLSQEGYWNLDDSVAAWLPGFARDDLTLRQLLTHTSGLIPHIPFFHLGQNPRAIRKAVYEEATRGGPVGTVLYSDLNFMLLGWAIARCSDQSLDRLFREVVAQPLQLTTTHYRPSARDQIRTAATELNGDQRLTKTLVWGEVHDGNAWALGGVAGHAGLFSTTSDMVRFTQSFLTPKRNPVLSATTIRKMTARQAGQLPDVRALGWRLEPKELGPWPEGTFWHTGFTGTSLLVCPALDIAVVLLTNAVHPVRQLEQQGAFRSAVHRSLAKLVA
jgi:CubicO group peptidase (beta-lactamase class C family)